MFKVQTLKYLLEHAINNIYSTPPPTSPRVDDVKYSGGDGCGVLWVEVWVGVEKLKPGVIEKKFPDERLKVVLFWRKETLYEHGSIRHTLESSGGTTPAASAFRRRFTRQAIVSSGDREYKIVCNLFSDSCALLWAPLPCLSRAMYATGYPSVQNECPSGQNVFAYRQTNLTGDNITLVSRLLLVPIQEKTAIVSYDHFD